MQKTLTKKQLAAKLDGIEYGDDIPDEIIEAAKESKLVIIHGGSDDIVSFFGAIHDERYACDGGTVQLTRTGIPRNECDDVHCPYFEAWNRQAVASGEIIVLEIFWCGKCFKETMDADEYAVLGKPTWCYRIKVMVGRYRREEIDSLVATFDIFDEYGNDRTGSPRGLLHRGSHRSVHAHTSAYGSSKH